MRCPSTSHRNHSILADMDAGQAFPTNYVSFGTTGLDLFLKKLARVIMQFRSSETYFNRQSVYFALQVRAGLALVAVLQAVREMT